jgi:hypothetical protein
MKTSFTIGPKLLDYASKKIVQFIRYSSGKVVKRVYSIGAEEPESVETVTDNNNHIPDHIHNQEFAMYQLHSRTLGM